MRQRLLCSLLAAGVIGVLSIPVFDGGHRASACSVPGCSSSSSSTGGLDSFVSPIAISSPNSLMIERSTTAQVSGIIALAGNVGFTVTDPRGNNDGFVTQLTSDGYSSSMVSSTVPASNIVVSGLPSVTLTCFTKESLQCAPGLGNKASVGATLDTNPVVAVECPRQSIGFGAYAISVPVSVSVTGMTAEIFGSMPLHMDTTYTASFTEGQPHDYFQQFGCPAYGS